MNRPRDSGIYEKLTRDSGSRLPLPDPETTVSGHSVIQWDPDITMHQGTGEITSLYRGLAVNESPI